MNIDPSTPAREVLIRYLETSGVNQQKEAAAEMRKMEREIESLNIKNWAYASKIRLNKKSFISRIVLWFKGK